MPIIVFLLVVAVGVAGIMLGYSVGKRDRPIRSDQHQLEVYSDLVDDLAIQASEHATLGSDFAVLTLGQIAQSRKALR